MTLSLRAHLLHEAKKLQDTLKALVVQNGIGQQEVFFINTLEHFITCARLERADRLQTSCRCVQAELARITRPADSTVIPPEVAAELRVA